MIVFPNCKINLGLKVIRKRPDGFHDIETVFYPVPLTDALEIIPTDYGTNTFKFSSSGLNFDGEPDENLCVQAYQLIKKKFTALPPVQIHLHKAIPIGAGLGGGSADAAFTLKILDKHFQLNLSAGNFLNYALQLGSDVPFFIVNKPCFASGRGEILKPVELNLSAYKIVVVYPDIHVNTAWAFSQIQLPDADLEPDTLSMLQILKQPVENWNDQLRNDFEPIIFNKYPGIREIKKKLSETGASYCSLSGSGSSVFAFFKKDHEIKLNFPDCLIKQLAIGNKQ